MLAAGVFLEIGARGGVNTISTSLGLVVLAGALHWAGRIENRASTTLLGAALLFAPWLFLRNAAGLTIATTTAIIVLLAVAAGVSRSGRAGRLRASALVAHVLAPCTAWQSGLRMARRSFAANPGHNWSGATLGIVLALPVVVVFALLLSSADGIFADVLGASNPGSIGGHAALTIVFSLMSLGIVSRTAHRTPPFEIGGRRWLGRLEASILLGSVVTLFAGFVLTQFVVALGGADHVLETAGLTRAEHARNGFFQLLWVAALSLMLVGGVRSSRTESTDPSLFRPLAASLHALTLVITGIAIQRLLLYVDAFGLTPLRLWALAFAAWIGLLLIAHAISIIRRDAGNWFPAFVVLSAVLGVLGLNIVNPDATIANYNIEHPPAERPVDVDALAGLSGDAVPAIVSRIHLLPPDAQVSLRVRLCEEDRVDSSYGALGWNRADRAATEALEDVCPRP